MIAALQAPFRREPVVLLGAVISGALAVQQALASAGVHSWSAAVPVLLAWGTRQFVTSPAGVAKLKSAQTTLASIDPPNAEAV